MRISERGAHSICSEIPASLANCIAFLLNTAAQQMREATEEGLEPLGIPSKHYSIIATISAEGPMTQQGLGNFLHIDRTTMVWMVDDMEKKGIVVREPNPEDRRCHAVSLSSAGREVFRKAVKRVARAEEEFLTELNANEKKELKRILIKLVRKHHEALPR